MGCLAAFEDRGWGVKRLLWIAGKEPTPALAQMAGRGGVLHCSGRMRDLGLGAVLWKQTVAVVGLCW